VFVDRGEIAAFADHVLEVRGENLGAHRSLDDPADFLHRLPIIAGLLRHQRRVGRHAIDDAEERELLDLLDIAGIHEEFHS
jgi:hypothetical protein